MLPHVQTVLNPPETTEPRLLAQRTAGRADVKTSDPRLVDVSRQEVRGVVVVDDDLSDLEPAVRVGARADELVARMPLRRVLRIFLGTDPKPELATIGVRVSVVDLIGERRTACGCIGCLPDTASRRCS